MKKWALVFLSVVLLDTVALAPVWSQDEIDLFDATGLMAAKRGVVIFLHDEHNEAAQIDACNECHHVYEEGVRSEDESSEDQQCAECHGQKADGAMPGLRRAFHLNCRGCHLQKKQGPVLCGQCHGK